MSMRIPESAQEHFRGVLMAHTRQHDGGVLRERANARRDARALPDNGRIAVPQPGNHRHRVHRSSGLFQLEHAGKDVYKRQYQGRKKSRKSFDP